MPQSLVKNLIHLVYSTKNHQPWIVKDHRDGLFAYQAGIFQKWDSLALVIGGVEDHVHALFALSKNQPLKKIVEEVKKGSSKWMKIAGPRNPDFHWQAGYGAFSVSESNLHAVRRYIENQKEHHRKMTFQDELRALFRRHGLVFDERFVWD
jgi:REP element-mobilizing transposase RayT